MKILITADPFLPVPPKLYGGIERVLDMLITEYIAKGYDVTLIAHKDSVPHESCRFIPYSSNNDSIFSNSLLITKSYLKYKFDIIHSFSRLLYLLPLLRSSVPKIMSYQREPSINQIKRAYQLSKNSTLLFTGCSDYISNQIKSVAKAYTVYNGVSLDNYIANDRISDDAALVFLGRIEEIKGTHVAIDMALKTNNKLIIAGNVPTECYQYFNEKIKPYLSEQIQYIGPVNDAQKNILLREAKALLMPIQWNEPFGIVMTEAMACGTPVIGYNRGAVSEVVEHLKSGFVCNSDDDFIEGIVNISKINRAEVRKIVERRFSSDVISNNYLALYHKLLER